MSSSSRVSRGSLARVCVGALGAVAAAGAAAWLITKRRRTTAATATAAGSATTAVAARPYSVLLFDVEGTTTPISFVKEILFPYVTAALAQHLASTHSHEQTRADIQALIDLSEVDEKACAAGVVVIPRFPAEGEQSAEALAEQHAAVVANVAWQMSTDRKSTALKALQGHLWQGGYQSGELLGQLFGGATGDVATGLRRWHAAGYTLAIYSSGSVEAQQLLFRHSDAGDLTPIIQANFDTRVGLKQEAASYARIAEQLGVPASRILFLTDIYGEAAAARQSGVDTLLLVRPGNYALPPEQSTEQGAFPIAHDFDEVETFLQQAQARQAERPTTAAEPAVSNAAPSAKQVDTSSGQFNTF